jgi:transglutaminase-like putative cysteine protease
VSACFVECGADLRSASCGNLRFPVLGCRDQSIERKHSGLRSKPELADRRSAPRGLAGALLFLALVCLAPIVSAEPRAIGEANKLELSGDFKQAAAVLENGINDSNSSEGDRKQLAFDLDRLQRIKRDFPFTADELFAELKQAVKALTRQEFDRWVQDGWFDSRQIDGQRYFMSASVSNLFFRHPELNPRRMPPKRTLELQKARVQSVRAIAAAARQQKTPYVLPKRFEVTMTVTAKSNAVPAGEIVRAWLPIPRWYPFQKDFELLSTSAPVKHLDDELSPIRSVFMEQTARKGEPTRFQIQYRYTAYGVRFEIDPNRVRACDPNDPELKPWVSEAPHVMFTPEIRALSEKIGGGETNPALKAKKFFDWIAENIQYSYAIEYSTIRNISDYCRTKGYGDCGQEALLFITLCRLNGIPARWQSGWNLFAGDKTIHDWSEIYLAPYGWMPVDPYMGILAMRYATDITPAERREIRDFYFGGLDQYRMAANRDHNQVLNPPKRTMRSDDVDFQRGELEAGNQNLYFHQYSFELNYHEVPRRAE